MRILITGGGGLLGQYLNLELSKDHEILTLYHKTPRNCDHFNSQQCDIQVYEKLHLIFRSFKPQVVVHTASISSPQKANLLPTKIVYDINVNATKNIAELCDKYKSKLIYTSTDLVYAGYRGLYLKEDAKLIPISLYAETKLMGEEKIKLTFDNYIILRTALMFGFGLNGASSFFHRMYEKIKVGEQVKIFSDQFRSPLSVFEAARIINLLCEYEVKSEIINFGGPERLSRFDLALKLCQLANFDERLLDKISMYEMENLSHVADVSMNADKLKSLGVNLLSVDESLKEILSTSK